jgi:hypothetical protein
MTIPTFDRNKTTNPRWQNRGLDTKTAEGDSTPVVVGLETIDTAIINYLQTNIKPVVNQQGKQIQIPVIYGNPERWKSAQQDGMYRDKNGMIQLPIMMIRRTGMKENAINNPTNKYQSYVFKTGWNSRNIYDKFAALNGITPSEQYQQTMIPDYYDISYESMIWTEFMEQMNKVVEQVSFENDEYWGQENNYKFKVKMGDFEQITDLPSKDARMVRSKFNFTVKAYILPQSALDKYGNRQRTTRLVYSPKKVVFDTELIVSQNNK